MTNCQTCKKKLTDCAGHFGYIQLELPVFHAGYFKHTLTIMQCICKKCSRVLVPPANRAKMLKSMQNPRIDALMRGGLYICI
jgi:DNA-directed RNA polymerase III subunit RPC1